MKSVSASPCAAAGTWWACSPTSAPGARRSPTAHALAAVTGNDRYREAASKLYVTGSFWCSAVSMAAALATLDVLESVDGPTRMREMGQRLRDGIAAQSAEFGIGVRQSGPPQMPTVLFDNRSRLREGQLLHPGGAEARRLPAPAPQHVPLDRPHRGRHPTSRLKQRERRSRRWRRGKPYSRRLDRSAQRGVERPSLYNWPAIRREKVSPLRLVTPRYARLRSRRRGCCFN